MILVDTSVWVDHLRHGDTALARRLDAGEVLCHPWVTGELALGALVARDEILRLLDELPQATVATVEETRRCIDRYGLVGTGIGYVDAQLLAATMLTSETLLWTMDIRLARQAARLGVAA